MSKTHCLYAVHFSDDRIKVGVTADVAKRMRYYVQESRRNRVEHLTWWSCAPMSKELALIVERHFCREMSSLALACHREWFDGDWAAFASVIAALERLRAGVALPNEAVANLPYMGGYGHLHTGATA